jgi:hypothetical protein
MPDGISRRKAVAGAAAALLAKPVEAAGGAPLRIARIGPASPLTGFLESSLVDPSAGRLDGVVITAPDPDRVRRHLAAGVPVWVDGPLARSVREAEALIEAARRGKAALLAGSVEEFLPSTTYLQRQARELAPLSAAMVALSTRGKGAERWAGVEAANLMCAIFGTKVSRVSRIANAAGYTIAFEYAGDRPLHVVAQGIPTAACRYWVRFYGADLVDRSGWDEDAAVHAALAMDRMFRERQAPQEASYLLEKTKLYLAACRATSVADGAPLAVGDLPPDWRLDA